METNQLQELSRQIRKQIIKDWSKENEKTFIMNLIYPEQFLNKKRVMTNTQFDKFINSFIYIFTPIVRFHINNYGKNNTIDNIIKPEDIKALLRDNRFPSLTPLIKQEIDSLLLKEYFWIIYQECKNNKYFKESQGIEICKELFKKHTDTFNHSYYNSFTKYPNSLGNCCTKESLSYTLRNINNKVLIGSHRYVSKKEILFILMKSTRLLLNVQKEEHLIPNKYLLCDAIKKEYKEFTDCSLDRDKIRAVMAILKEEGLLEINISHPKYLSRLTSRRHVSIGINNTFYSLFYR